VTLTITIFRIKIINEALSINDTQHNNKNAALSIMTFNMTTLSIMKLFIMTLSITTIGKTTLSK